MHGLRSTRAGHEDELVSIWEQKGNRMGTDRRIARPKARGRHASDTQRSPAASYGDEDDDGDDDECCLVNAEGATADRKLYKRMSNQTIAAAARGRLRTDWSACREHTC